jgi:drug/metabolite transporter, DME family
VLAASVLWGTTGTAATLAPAVGPLAIGAAAMGLGGLLQALSAARPITRQRAALCAQRRIVLFGGAAVAVYPLAFYTSMRLAGVAVGTVVSIGSAPLASALAERIIDRRCLTVRWMCGAALGLAGIVLLCLAEATRPRPGHAATWPVVLGVGLGLVAGATYAIYSWAAHRLMGRDVTSRAAMGAVFGLGGLLLVPVLLATGAPLAASVPNAAIGAYMALVPMFAGYVLFGWGLARVPASTATTLSLLEPAIATILAVAVVREHLPAAGWAGLALICGCLAVLTVPRGVSVTGLRAAGEEQELAAGVAALADLEGGLPVFEGERPGNRHGELALGGELRELGERIDTLGPVLMKGVANAELFGGGEVGDREYPFRVAPGDLNEIGQSAAGRCGVEDEVDRTVADGPDPFGHALPVRGDRGAEIAQPLGVGWPGSGDHPEATEERDLHGGVSDGAPGAVDQDRLPGVEPEPREMLVGGVERHRQRGRLGEVEAGGDRDPAVHDRAVRRTRGRACGPVGGSGHEVADADVGDAVTDGVDGAGYVDADTARQLARKQAPAQRPIGRGQSAGVDGNADAPGTRRRHRHGLQVQNGSGLAVFTEAHGPHGLGRGVRVSHVPVLVSGPRRSGR